MLRDVLEEIVGRRLRAVKRFAWHPDDGSSADLDIGSVHLLFAGGLGAHLDAAADWTLRWSVSWPGDEGRLDQYRYDFHGRWLMRDSSHEEPFVGLLGSLASAASPTWNEVNEVVGVNLTFGDRALVLDVWGGEIDTSTS